MFIITGIIIPLVLYLITLPLQSFLFVLRQTLKSEEKRLKGRLVGSSKLKHILGGINTNLRDRITEKNSDKSSVDVKSISMRIRSLKALQSLIASISFLITFMRSVAQTMLCFIVTVSVSVIPLVLVLLMSSVGYFFISDAFDGVIFGSGGVISGNIVDEGGESGNSIAYDNSSWLSSIETMANWYIKNVPTYQTSYNNVATGHRGMYSCDLFDKNSKVGDDCTGFVYACLVYAGLVKDSPSNAPCSNDYVGGTPLKVLTDGGFERLKAGQGFEWQAGDIASISGHVEIVVSVEGDKLSSFGWGKIRSEYPSATYASVSSFKHSHGYYTYCYRLRK